MASTLKQSAGSPSAESQKPQVAEPSKIMEPHEYWAKSTTSEKNLKKLREWGLLPNPKLYEWVATKGQSHPTPDTHQVAIFIAHFLCGFGVYPSKFLERICRHYGIEIAHLLPNAVGMLSAFAVLCEAWLSIEPYVDLWHYFYSANYYHKCFMVGSVGFSLRKA